MDIVEEIRNDREAGARRLETEYKAGLMTLAVRLCRDPADAEELVNHTFAEVIAGIDGFLEQSAFFTWMCRILVRCHAKEERRKSREREVCDSDAVESAADDDSCGRLLREVDAGLLRDAVEELPEEIRNAVVLHYFMGVSAREAARILSIPSGTMLWRLHYARMLLAAKLGAAAKKPGGKALLVALSLAAITAAGAATSLAVARLLSPAPAAQEQQAYDSKNAAAPSLATVPLREGGCREAASSRTAPLQEGGCRGATGGSTPTAAEGTGETSASDAASVPPVRSSFETDSSTPQTPPQEQTMNATTLRTLAASAALAVSTGTADTLTWIGGSSGLLSASSNWTSSGNHSSPQPGDTCVFPSSAVTLEEETFDFGSGGLTFENNATLTVLTHFAGSGGITKRGGGDLAVKNTTAGTFTGDVTIEAGRLLANSGGGVQFGLGTIVFTESSTSHAFMRGDGWGLTVKNDLEFQGESSGYAIHSSQNATYSGTITSLHDFTINNAYATLNVTGNISAPGRKMTVTCSDTWNSVNSTFSGTINASLVKKSPKDVTLSGRSDYADNTLHVEGGTAILSSSGYWGGTNVQVVGSTAVLRLQGSQNLSMLASVQLSGGGKLNLDSACAATVAKLIVDGVEKDSGTYSAANLPDSITGSGTISVSPKTWIGGAVGYLSAPGNWSDGTAPRSGDVLLFTNAVELLHQTVDVGADGLTLSSSHEIQNHVWFTGSGGIVKRGPRGFYLHGDAGGDFAGGARFEAGSSLHLVNNQSPAHKFFGTGPVALDGNRTRIYFDKWACGLTNTVVISNAVSNDNSGFGSLTVTQGATTMGPIVASSNFEIHGRDHEMHFPSIEAPGHTVRFDTYWGSSAATFIDGINLDGPVNASVTREGNRPIYFNGSSPNPDNSLTLDSGTNTLSAAAYWGGTNIVVSGATTCLALKGSGNLSETAAIAVSSGGKIDIASGVKVKVGALTVDGVAMADGIYDAANLPSAITGGGKLRIGEGATVLYIR